MNDSLTDMAAKASVPLTVSGLTIFGVQVPDLVQIATGIYVVLMGLDKIYIMFLRYRESRNKELHEIKDELK